MKQKFNAFGAATAFFALVLQTGHAQAAGPADVARLGQDLTAVGAERAGNKDGTIPAFTGPSKPQAGWAPGKLREDFWQYKTDKPLFVIDASNVDKHASKLTAGQVEMLKTLKGYTIPVYPTRRECGVPDFMEKNTKDGALKSAIGKDGWSLEKATLPGVPFPVPSNGVEAVWNWLMRYQGLATEYFGGYTYVSPRPGATQSIVTRFDYVLWFPWAQPGQNSPESSAGLQQAILYTYQEPVALAGQIAVTRFFYDKDNETFLYFPGQRRVRRLPSYAYDAPLIGYENQFPADAYVIFSGAPDRFDWKLVGKKEIYIPYNSFAQQRFNSKLEDTVQEKFINANVRRYELHRVWEVVGTVKQGVRHSSPKKTLYFDEDSWLLVAGDDFDVQGKLWRAKENFTAMQWEIGACATNGTGLTDLASGRFILDTTVIGSGKDVKYFPPTAKDPRFTDNYFTSGNLSSLGQR